MDLKNDWSEPASAKYTVLENSTTPGKQHAQRQYRPPWHDSKTYNNKKPPPNAREKKKKTKKKRERK
jgi:hypothetical protein